MNHKHSRGTQNITGHIATLYSGSQSGAFYPYGTFYRGTAGPAESYGSGFDASRSWSGRSSVPEELPTGSTTGNELRPNNYTNRIWVRVS